MSEPQPLIAQQQSPMFSAFKIPFSDEELLLAFRAIMPDSAAGEALRTMRESERKVNEDYAAFQRDPASFLRDQGLVAGEQPVFGLNISHDTMIILSLISEELNQRVADYRKWKGSSADEDSLWNARRELLKPHLTAKLEELKKRGG